MVEQGGADAPVDALHPESGRELAERQRHYGQVVNRPAADGERCNTRLGVLAAGKRALHLAELRQAKLLREVRVERDFRTPGVDEEGDLLAAVHAPR